MIPLRILHISKYYPPEFGGIETVARDLSTGFAEYGHDSSVLALTKFESKKENLEGVAVTRCSAPRTIMSQPLSLRWFERAIAMAKNADVVIVQWPNLLPMLLVPFWRRQLVIIFWQSDLIGKGLAARMMRPFQALMLKSAGLVWTSTPRYAESSKFLQPVRKKVRALPIGISDPTLEAPAEIPADIQEFADGRQIVLSIGRLVPYKGFDQLIRAFADVDTSAVLVIIGTGPQDSALRVLIASLELETRVLLAGRASEEGLRGALRGASLYVMSSNQRSEAFGVVQVEAMAFGLPIVATRVPNSGVDWVSGEGVTGAVVPINDPPAMAEAINGILTDNPARKSFGLLSRKRFEQEFTRDKMVDRAMAMIEEYRKK